MSTSRSAAPEPESDPGPLLEYVTTTGCTDCRDFEDVLARVRPDFPALEVREVPGESARGLALSVERGVLRFPIVVLDDEIIAIESIAEEELRVALGRRAVTT
jgi:glutaredoxin